MVGITKSFPGVKALDGVSMELRQGECHAIVGENGAGKSTLMKTLSGAYTADAGTIAIDGVVVQHPSPKSMAALGVVVIYQELTVAANLSVAENVYLGRMPRTRIGTIDWRKAEADTAALFERLGVTISPKQQAGDLSIAQMQMVEIAKALSQQARVLVLDEPSAVLGDAEVSRLFEIMRSLQSEGVSFFYISHRLKEVFEIGQRVTVLRDGSSITSGPVEDFTVDSLVKNMVGRELANIYPERDREPGAVVLEAKGLVRGDRVRGVDLTLREGEIVGIAGLAGAGRTEILRLLAGADQMDAGTIEVHGKRRVFRGPRQAIRAGIGLLPEDRKGQGLFLGHSIRFNMSSGNLKRYSAGPILRLRKEREHVQRFSDSLRIKAPSIDSQVGGLSGGNQQKAVFGRWLAADAKVLLADEPTRGVDVGAKQDIYRLLDEFAREGLAVVFVSSELPEVLGLADRILVVREGRITAELEGATATEELIIHHATDASGRAVAEIPEEMTKSR
ncbi:sugar ABC transporter ATP-binding protein [Agrococcus sp. ARC_14]|uniref:sugar ABC transporter ATP-binding protein n=1 Tax=Agrococcus sp. ARC_14 TaxID=2919927 RepID=UPI002407F621|nr:sugar ABC transporter ATP-binding protein [Agrococcus sp. ARC_14]